MTGSAFDRIWELAKPYLDTRESFIHTEISAAFARTLLDREGGDPGIVLPGIIRHDVGWKALPEEVHGRHSARLVVRWS